MNVRNNNDFRSHPGLSLRLRAGEAGSKTGAFLHERIIKGKIPGFASHRSQ